MKTKAEQDYQVRLNTMRAATAAKISTTIVASWADNPSLTRELDTVGRWQVLEDMCHGASLALAIAGLPDLSDDYAMLANVAGQHKWDTKRAMGQAGA